MLLALFPFCVVALGVAGVVAGLQAGGRAGSSLAILGLGVVIALGLALVQAVRVRLSSPEGPRLSRQEQPGLWRLVDELAARAHTRPPDEIVLVADALGGAPMGATQTAAQRVDRHGQLRRLLLLPPRGHCA